MFAERNWKTTQPGDWKLLMDQLLEGVRRIFTPHEGTAGLSAGWQTGLIVDPGSFTEQLNRLQYSLHRANQPVIGQDADETVAARGRLKN